MKRTFPVKILSMTFTADEEAHGILKQYLSSLRLLLGNEKNGRETIHDIETRLCELLSERVNHPRGVISISVINDVKSIIGEPGDILGPAFKANGPGIENPNFLSGLTPGRNRRSLSRDTNNKFLGGVCSGIAAYFNIDPVIIRVLFVILLSTLVIVPVYLILWIAMPAAVPLPSVRLSPGPAGHNPGDSISTKPDDERWQKDFLVIAIAAILAFILLGGKISGLLPIRVPLPASDFWPWSFPLMGFFPIIILIALAAIFFPSARRELLVATLVLIVITIALHGTRLIFNPLIY